MAGKKSFVVEAQFFNMFYASYSNREEIIEEGVQRAMDGDSLTTTVRFRYEDTDILFIILKLRKASNECEQIRQKLQLLLETKPRFDGIRCRYLDSRHKSIRGRQSKHEQQLRNIVMRGLFHQMSVSDVAIEVPGRNIFRFLRSDEKLELRQKIERYPGYPWTYLFGEHDLLGGEIPPLITSFALC